MFFHIAGENCILEGVQNGFSQCMYYFHGNSREEVNSFGNKLDIREATIENLTEPGFTANGTVIETMKTFKIDEKTGFLIDDGLYSLKASKNCTLIKLDFST